MIRRSFSKFNTRCFECPHYISLSKQKRENFSEIKKQSIKDDIIRRNHYLDRAIEAKIYSRGYLLLSGTSFCVFLQMIPMYTTSVPYVSAVSSGIFFVMSKTYSNEMIEFHNKYEAVDKHLIWSSLINDTETMLENIS